MNISDPDSACGPRQGDGQWQHHGSDHCELRPIGCTNQQCR